MAGVLADDVLHATALNATTVFATRFDGGADFHGKLGGGSWRWSRRSSGGVRAATGQTDIVGSEAVDDTAFLQIVGGHLHANAVAGKDAHLVNPHASGQVAQERMILRFVGGDAHLERRVGITFLHDADELNHVLGHKRRNG